MSSDFDDMIEGKDLEPNFQTGKALFYAVLLFSTLVYVIFIIETADYAKQVESEVRSLRSITGIEEFKEVTGRADRWYESVMITSGGQEFLKRAFGKHVENEKLKFGLSSWTNRLANNIPYIFYQGAFRLSSFTLWAWILLPFAFACIADAVNMWRAKIYGFAQMRIRKFHLWRRLMGYVFISTLGFFLIPAMAGAFTVYLPPAIIIITIFLLTRWIKEYQIHL